MTTGMTSIKRLRLGQYQSSISELINEYILTIYIYAISLENSFFKFLIFSYSRFHITD